MAVDYSSIIGSATNAYNATLAGYKTTLAQQQQAQAGTVAGYNALQGTVLGGLEQSSNVAGQQIANQYKQAADKSTASLVGRGLYNTSMQDSLQKGLTESQAFAQNDRMAKYATMAADKTTQLGLAGLGYQGQAQASDLNFAGQGLQYGGQEALQLGNLAQGFAGLENQKAMQQAALDQQLKIAKLQLYGAGGQVYGMGGSGSAGGAKAPAQAGPGYGGGADRPQQMFDSSLLGNQQGGGAYGASSPADTYGEAGGGSYGGGYGDWGGGDPWAAGGDYSYDPAQYGE